MKRAKLNSIWWKLCWLENKEMYHFPPWSYKIIRNKRRARREKSGAESWKESADQGLSSKKSLTGKRRNSGYYFQLFLKLEQRKENKKIHTHTHKKNPWLGATGVCSWKESPCLYWSKVLKISKEQIYWFLVKSGCKKEKE